MIRKTSTYHPNLDHLDAILTIDTTRIEHMYNEHNYIDSNIQDYSRAKIFWDAFKKVGKKEY